MACLCTAYAVLFEFYYNFIFYFLKKTYRNEILVKYVSREDPGEHVRARYLARYFAASKQRRDVNECVGQNLSK